MRDSLARKVLKAANITARYPSGEHTKPQDKDTNERSVCVYVTICDIASLASRYRNIALEVTSACVSKAKSH